MADRKVKNGGGWASIRYSWKMARRVGGAGRLYRALKSRNTCKACALGMSGMRNEMGKGLQVCKKSMQAQAQDMQPAIEPQFFADHSVEMLSGLTGHELESLGRLADPLLIEEGDTHFRTIDWPQALNRLRDEMKRRSVDRSFFYTSGRSSMEAAFLVQLLARQWGTNNVNNCSYYCHQASGVGLSQSIGSGTATVMLEDIEKCDLVVLIGANPASNHPRFMTYLAELRRRGGTVIVINPLKELGLVRFKVPSDVRSMLKGSEIASQYVQPHCGGDLAFLKAAALYLWQKDLVDRSFLQANCNNFQELAKDLEESKVNVLLEMAGVSHEHLEEFCGALTASRNTIFSWAMGVTHQLHGVQTVRMIANLALMRGMIGRPGAGLLPLRGHSNVQGVGTVGVVPKLKPAMIEKLARNLNIRVPESPGMDTFKCMEAAHAGEVDFGLLLGGNLFGSNPDQNWAGEALNRIDFTCFVSTTLNLGHVNGRGRNTLILPVRARDEEKQSTSQESMFNYVRLSTGGSDAPADTLPAESEIFSWLGEQLFGNDPVAWSKLNDHHHVRQLIADNVPSLEPMSKLDQGAEFTIPGRIKHKPKFNTENKKANLAIVQAVDARPEDNGFNLTTMRSEGQFNTIVYENEDLYRGARHRMVVFMSRDDIAARNLREGAWVWVESEAGRMRVEILEADIRPGNVAMYYPEANVIVPPKIDPQSKTPSFKRISVRISAEEETPVQAAMAEQPFEAQT